MKLELRLCLECRVCRRYVTAEQIQHGRMLAQLVGTTKYGMCWCGLETDRLLRADRNFRRRWRRREKVLVAGQRVKIAEVSGVCTTGT